MIRELIREGAEVDVMLSPASELMMSDMIFEWASGKPVFTDITGNIEHVLLAGAHPEKVDLVIIAPLTANTLGKIVHGVADSNVSLTAMTAIGNDIPLLLVPGMHEPMFNNPGVQQNKETICKWSNITWLDPRVEESKAKVPDLFTVVHWVIRLLSPQTMKNKKVLVTTGPTREFVDKVRFISNPSSGKMGYAFALDAWYQGADVHFIIGPNNLQDLPDFSIYPVTSVNEMAKSVEQVIREIKPDYAIFAAAVADYQPVEIQEKKILSGKDKLEIELKPTIKIINLVRELKKELNLPQLKVIGFKAEYSKTKDEFKVICEKFIVDNLAQVMIANEIGQEERDFGVDSTEVFVFSNSFDPTQFKGTKFEIAQQAWKIIK
jgi:phosphopantothenoylcysteine decarboxylase/phosphopantothenate--cysteine ligase